MQLSKPDFSAAAGQMKHAVDGHKKKRKNKKERFFLVGFRGLKKENRREKVLLRLEEKRKETEKREGRELSFFFSLSFSYSIKAEKGEGVRFFFSTLRRVAKRLEGGPRVTKKKSKCFCLAIVGSGKVIRRGKFFLVYSFRF